MGDLLNLSALSKVELICLIEKASTELRQRLTTSSGASDSFSVASFEPVGESTATGSELKKPWTCGYECRWCKAPCTRAEGHKNHSCYNHRHRR